MKLIKAAAVSPFPVSPSLTRGSVAARDARACWARCTATNWNWSCCFPGRCLGWCAAEPTRSAAAGRSLWADGRSFCRKGHAVRTMQVRPRKPLQTCRVVGFFFLHLFMSCTCSSSSSSSSSSTSTHSWCSSQHSKLPGMQRRNSCKRVHVSREHNV